LASWRTARAQDYKIELISPSLRSGKILKSSANHYSI
jgi:hypothetical protein